MAVLNTVLRHQCIVTALNIIIHNNIVYFCLETQQMYQRLHVFFTFM